jgi:hypothetical protein
MFMPVVDIPERLRGEPAPVAAVGPVLAVVFREILDQPTPGEMQQLLHRVRERDGGSSPTGGASILRMTIRLRNGKGVAGAISSYGCQRPERPVSPSRRPAFDRFASA